MRLETKVKDKVTVAVRARQRRVIKTTHEKEEEVVEVVTPVVEQSEREMKTLRAVLNANIAACYLKLVRLPSIQSQQIQLNLPRKSQKTLLNHATQGLIPKIRCLSIQFMRRQHYSITQIM